MTYRADLRVGLVRFAAGGVDLGPGATTWLSKTAQLDWIAERSLRTAQMMERALASANGIRSLGGGIMVVDPKSGAELPVPPGMVSVEVLQKLKAWKEGIEAKHAEKKAVRKAAEVALDGRVGAAKDTLDEINGSILVRDEARGALRKAANAAGDSVFAAKSDISRKTYAQQSIKRRLESKFLEPSARDSLNEEALQAADEIAKAEYKLAEMSEVQAIANEALAEANGDLLALRARADAIRAELSILRSQRHQATMDELATLGDLLDPQESANPIPEEILRQIRQPLVRAFRQARVLAEDRQVLATFSREDQIAGRARSLDDQQRLARALAVVARKRPDVWETGHVPLTIEKL